MGGSHSFSDESFGPLPQHKSKHSWHSPTMAALKNIARRENLKKINKKEKAVIFHEAIWKKRFYCLLSRNTDWMCLIWVPESPGLFCLSVPCPPVLVMMLPLSPEWEARTHFLISYLPCLLASLLFFILLIMFRALSGSFSQIILLISCSTSLHLSAIIVLLFILSSLLL